MGKAKKAKIEYQLSNSTGVAWFRLRKGEYGSKGEWVLLKNKGKQAAATEASKAAAAPENEKKKKKKQKQKQK